MKWKGRRQAKYEDVRDPKKKEIFEKKVQLRGLMTDRIYDPEKPDLNTDFLNHFKNQPGVAATVAKNLARHPVDKIPQRFVKQTQVTPGSWTTLKKKKK